VHPFVVFSVVVIFGGLCLWWPVLSHLITLSCIPSCVYGYSREYLEAYRKRKNWVLRKYFLLGLWCFLFAFGLWLVDRFMCEDVTRLGMGYLQLHAAWHVMITCSFWFLTICGIMTRLIGDKKKYILKRQCLDVVPTISIQE